MTTWFDESWRTVPPSLMEIAPEEETVTVDPSTFTQGPPPFAPLPASIAWAPAAADQVAAPAFEPAAANPPGTDYAGIARTPEFAELRSRRRRFVFPMTALFLTWYLAYIVLTAYARDFMARPVVGLVTLGMVLGLAQIATTVVIGVAYAVYARRRIDPQAEIVRTATGER